MSPLRITLLVLFAPVILLSEKAVVDLPDDAKEFDFWLQPNCLNFPAEPFSEQNYVEDTHLWLVHDQVVPDFVLKTTKGEVFQLSKLLEEKPVFLQFGSYTCPNYRKWIDVTNRYFADWGDQLHFVVVYVIEAHPKAPDVSPYKGVVSEGPWSHYGQLTTYKQRVEAAEKVEVLHNDGIIYLIDTLEDEYTSENNNWVWCQYGPAANPGYLIRQDQTLEIGMEWFTPAIMEAAFKRFLGGTHVAPGFPSGESESSIGNAESIKNDGAGFFGTSDIGLAVGLLFMLVLIFTGAYLIAQQRRKRGYRKIEETQSLSEVEPLSADNFR